MADHRNAWLYTWQARLNGMHGRRVPVAPPRPVLLHLLWGDKTPALLHARRFDRLRGWLGEITAVVQASDVEPDHRTAHTEHKGVVPPRDGDDPDVL